MVQGYQDNKSIPRTDLICTWLYIALVGIGLISIYSAGTVMDQSFKFNLSTTWGKQFIWICICIVIIFTILFTNPTLFEYSAYGIYAVTILLNILVLFLGREVNGAKSWFGFGGFGIQPGEFAKLGTALALAKWLGTYGVKFSGFKNIGITVAIFMLPMAIILVQNDTGSALVYLSFVLVLYREGLPGWILVAAGSLGVIAVIMIVFAAKLIAIWYFIIPVILICFLLIYYFRKNTKLIVLIATIAFATILFALGVNYFYKKALKNYQRDRIELVLGLKKDTKGMGYNLEQSRIAIGAGGLVGRGYLEGTQTKMGFVPEQETDFIFCTIGEEWGFLGVIVFLGIYIGLLWRIVVLAEKQVGVFERVLGYSLACILFTHITINIGMTIGLVPVIGIPLPFVSAGGSSLIAFTILLFSFLKLDQRRKAY